MKLRHLFVTFLAAGMIAGGILWLIAAVLRTAENPLPTPVVKTKSTTPDKQKEADTLKMAVATADVLEKDTVPPVAAPLADSLRITADAETNSYNTQTLHTIAEKYAGQQPAVWSDHVTGMVFKAALPASEQRIVFLTFNAYTKNDPALFDLLQQHRVKATLFLTGNWVRRNAEQAKQLGALTSLFKIENHGNRNRPLSANGATAYHIHTGTSNLTEMFNEITTGAEAIQNATGQTPRYARPFLNYADNIVIDALRDASIKTIGATAIADGGGLFASDKIKEQLLNAPHGAILLLNVNPDYPNILKGLRAAIEAIEKENLPIRFEHLADYEQYFEYIP